MGTRRLLAAAALLAVLMSGRQAWAIAQSTGDFELEMDAPWRMEPRAGGYGAIPIQISIHDADQPATGYDLVLQHLIAESQQGAGIADVVFSFVFEVEADVLDGLDDLLAWFLGVHLLPSFDGFTHVVQLDQFVSLTVYEEIGGRFVARQTFGIGNLHEIERTIGLWQWAANQSGPESPFAPPPRPTWQICRHWAGDNCAAFAALRPTSEWNAIALYNPTSPAPGRDVRLKTVLTVRTFDNLRETATHQYTRFLSVHLGEAPLPRFGAGWAYGDLHYHSQGTDNDGESGYSYRGVLQAMGAIGLDFSFATDHASNSPQIGSAQPIPTPELVMGIPRGVRDMSPDRFSFLLDVLNSSTGGNRQVGSYPRATGEAGGLVAPQLFLGAEVDVVPEYGQNDLWSGYPCADMPDILLALQQQTPFVDHYWCNHTMSVPIENGRRLMLDVQGPADGDFLSTHFYARQHLLHLPTDPTRHDAFIPSNTSKYGGATRRLGEILNTELGQRQKGYIFLAHPFNRSSGAEVGRIGPDLIPYSATQLADAFASPYVLGLELWNEDILHTADATDVAPFNGTWTVQKEQFDPSDLSRWDIVQLWGLDSGRTSALSWLPAGQPRRTFLAGGSDAHGDFNYRRTGEFLGTKGANDDALGKPRNLVYVGEPQGTSIASSAGAMRPLSQQQVVAGLRTGDFAVTNGPAVRIAYDVNGNGVIDDADVPMGGVANFYSLHSFRVVVEWKSSPEFAPVQWIDLYLGVFAAGHSDGMVYSPWRVPAGSHVHQSDIGGAKTFTDPNSSVKYTQTPSFPYWYDPTEGTLAITPYAGEEYEGRRVVTIDVSRFPVGDGVCVRKIIAPTYKTAPNPRTAAATLLTGATAGATTDPTTKPPATTTVIERQISLDVRLQQLIDGTVSFPPPIPCDAMEFQNAVHPDKLFVRAEVRNGLVPGSNMNCQDAPIGDQVPCVHRHAFTNPVWVNVLGCTGPICEVTNGGNGTLTSFVAPETGGTTPPTNPTKAGAVATLGTTALTR